MTTSLDLHIGTQFTGISVVPDAKSPGIWRIRNIDGQLSDMVNLTRAKDPAVAHARKKGLGGSEIARWYHRQTAPEAPPSDFSEGQARGIADETENAPTD